MVSVKKDGDNFMVCVTVDAKDVGGESPSVLALLSAAHQQVVQQMTLEGQASNAAVMRKNIADAEKCCLSIEG